MRTPARSSGPRTSGIRVVPARARRPVVQRVDVGEQHAARRRGRGARPARPAGRCRRSGSRAVATVSFSLTTGTTPRSSSRSQGAAGVGVVGAAGHVVGGQQHLPDREAVPRRTPACSARPAGPCPTLAAACWVARSRGPAGQAQRRRAGRDGAGGDQHHLACRLPRWAARTSTSAGAAASRSSSPSPVVSEDEPTLTTSRRGA